MLKQILLTTAMLSAGICTAQDGNQGSFSRDYPEDACRKVQKTLDTQETPVGRSNQDLKTLRPSASTASALPVNMKGEIASFLSSPQEITALRVMSIQWKKAAETTRQSLTLTRPTSPVPGARVDDNPYKLSPESDALLLRMLKGFTNIHTLKLCKLHLNADLGVLAQLPLKNLYFKDSPLGSPYGFRESLQDSTLGKLPPLPALESLDMDGCYIWFAFAYHSWFGSHQAVFAKLPGLKSLTLAGCHEIAPGWDTRLKDLPLLCEFAFPHPGAGAPRSCNVLTAEEISTLLANLPANLDSIDLSRQPNLKSIHIFDICKRFKTLTCLTVAGCKTIGTYYKIRQLARLQLTKADFSHTKLCRKNLNYLLSIPGLRHLNITGLKLHNDNVSNILKHPELETLSFSGIANCVNKEGLAELADRFDYDLQALIKQYDAHHPQHHGTPGDDVSGFESESSDDEESYHSCLENSSSDSDSDSDSD